MTQLHSRAHALRVARRIGIPAFDAVRTYWGTAALVAATAAVALGAALPVTSLARQDGSGLLPRLELDILRALEPAASWIEPLSPPAMQNEAVAVLFQLLLGTAAATLAVAGLTLVGLFAARASQRTHETAVRRAVGASRYGLLGSTLLEAGALALVALIVGISAGAAGAGLALATWPSVTVPGSLGASVVAVGATSAAICLGAVLPAVFAPGRRIAETPSRPLGLLVPALQLGTSLLVLTLGAVLIRQADIRLTPERVATANGSVFEITPRDLPPAQRAGQYAELLSQLANRTDLDTVSLTSPGVLLGLGTVSVVTTVCRPCTEGGIRAPWHFVSASHQLVSPDSFQALGVRLLAGRGIGAADEWDAPRVAVVSRGLAIRHFAKGAAIGGMIRPGNDTEWHKVVGVVEDPPASGLGAGLQPPYTVYLSILQHPASSVELLVRSRGQSADPLLPVVLKRALAPRRGGFLQMTEPELLAAQTAPLHWFGYRFRMEGWAMLTIAVTGAYTLMRLWVLSLLAELGLRRAVGATRRRLLALVFWRAASVGVGGLGVGLWLGPGVWDVLQSVAGELPRWDPGIAARFAGVLFGTTIAGAMLPAWRATRRPPAVLLRSMD